MKKNLCRVFVMSVFSASCLLSWTTCKAGTVAAWGENYFGQTDPVSETNIIGIATGAEQTLLLKSDGTVSNYGVHWEPPAGTNTTWAYPIIVPPGLNNIVAVAGGYAHSVALKGDGTVVAWGRNTYGQTNVPPGLTNVVAISACDTHTLALKSDGTVVAWGGSDTNHTNVPVGLNHVVAVAAGTDDLALKDDGTVVGWGPNTNLTAILSGLSNIVAISAGWAMDGVWTEWIALQTDGTVLGYSVPADLTNVVAITASSGTDHHVNMAVRADGTVVGWGFNFYGGSTVAEGLTNVIAVSSDGSHSLALSAEGGPMLHASMINPSRDGGGFAVSIPSQSGKVYRLEYETSITANDWTALPLVAGNGGVVVLRDPVIAGTQRFYRVRRW
ncbi:MAG TPA: hypothetical protein VK327_10615 [Candidatus Paceibacterota bacterium]|nr:hypothetical protein [Candidatus Paceibacterota bacterium]